MAVRKRPRKTPNGKLEAYIASPQKTPKVEIPRDLSLLPYSSRFAPLTDSDLFDPNLKSAALRFLRSFERDKSDAFALLILGPTGCGKTSSIRCVARALNKKIVEVTTTDDRSSQGLKRVLGEATQTHNVLQTAVLLIDDVDVVSEQDKGFYKALGDLMEASKVPIVLTAMHLPASLPWKDRVKVYELKQPEEVQMVERLESISKAVVLNVPESVTQALWRGYKGKPGAILNALQLSDLALMTGLHGDVATLSVSATETTATGRALWTSHNNEQSLSVYIDFLHSNCEKLFPQLQQLSGFEDLLCCFDRLQQYCVDAVSTDVRVLDQMLCEHSLDEVVIGRETARAEMEFPVLARAETSPYRTRSKARRPA